MSPRQFPSHLLRALRALRVSAVPRALRVSAVPRALRVGTRPGAPRASRQLRARRAFTLVEVLIAIILLAVGVLALSSTAVAVSRQTTLGVRQNLAAKVAQSRFEWMRTRTCAQLHDSATTTRGIAEGWVVIAGHNATAQATVTVRIPGRRTTESFTTALAC